MCSSNIENKQFGTGVSFLLPPNKILNGLLSFIINFKLVLVCSLSYTIF